MKNLINEGSESELHGGQLYAVHRFVDRNDLEGMSVLDIGCGFGWFEHAALRLGIKKICALDVSDQDLAAVRKHITDQRVEFKVGSGIKLPYPDQTFDTVVSWEVLEHIPKGTEPEFFREIKRVIKPNGKIYLSTPHNSLLVNLLDPAYSLIGHRHYSLPQIAGLAANAGLHVETMTVKGGIFESLFILNLYIAKWIFRRRPFFEAWFHRVSDRRYMEQGAGTFQIFVKLASTLRRQAEAPAA
ncbi:MAG: class I SAM-dependent methyltransferase [Deltaproteobacteria bacterium]|nr:class I SAM-dependent methyltransferase [Deltaproteobacteria bacterium]